MQFGSFLDCLEQNPVIAAIGDDKWDAAIASPAKVLFYLSADIMTVSQRIRQAHDANKIVFVHADLSEGIGKDRAGIRFLVQSGVDGIISTKAQLIRFAKEQGILTVQRFFTLDSKGMESMEDILRSTNPHTMELMPGVIGKTIARFSKGNTPVIAGGLIQTKAEVMDALGCGAAAVSTGQKELWYI